MLMNAIYINKTSMNDMDTHVCITMYDLATSD